MRIHLLKLTITLSLGILFTIYSFNGSTVRAFSSGPDPSNTGAPGESTCASCHGGGPTGGTLSISGLPANYSPNQEVTLTVNLPRLTTAARGPVILQRTTTARSLGSMTCSAISVSILNILPRVTLLPAR